MLNKMVKLNLISKMRYNIAHGLVTAAQNAPNARISADGLPWREAASLMLVSPSGLVQNSESGNSNESSQGTTGKKKPHFLITKRSQNSGSFSNILCFPGGNACPEDSNLNWIQLFGITSGINIVEKEVTFISKSGQVPSIYNPLRRNQPNLPKGLKVEAPPPSQSVPASISLRLTAIRETFEETGILLCKPHNKDSLNKGVGKDSQLGVGYEANVILPFENPDELKGWQERVRRSPAAFMEMCTKFNCVPDINALVEWNDWLTPNCFGVQRYDTIFYMALVPESYHMYLCPKEVESASWLTADKVLKDCEEKKCKMITPQIYELSRLRSSTRSMLSQLMKIRLALGIERWCPAYLRAKDGYLSVFPGDDLYPLDIKIETYEPIGSMEDSTLDELRETSFRHHRIEYRSEFDFRVVIKNYKERAGHVYLD